MRFEEDKNYGQRELEEERQSYWKIMKYKIENIKKYLEERKTDRWKGEKKGEQQQRGERFGS